MCSSGAGAGAEGRERAAAGESGRVRSGSVGRGPEEGPVERVPGRAERGGKLPVAAP